MMNVHDKMICFLSQYFPRENIAWLRKQTDILETRIEEAVIILYFNDKKQLDEVIPEVMEIIREGENGDWEIPETTELEKLATEETADAIEFIDSFMVEELD